MLFDAAKTGTPIQANRVRGPQTATFGKPNMAVVARDRNLAQAADSILKTGQELNDLYTNRILPKIKSGQISPMGQGFDYAEPGWARMFGGQMDPDVREFITRSGAFATAVNSYYAAQGGTGGSKGGVGAYEKIAIPHIPHPPGGPLEILGLSPHAQQWDLQKQGESIPDILSQIKLDQRQRGMKSYAPLGGGSEPGLGDPTTAYKTKHGIDW